MTTSQQFVAAVLFVHVALAIVAMVVALRSRAYSRRQLAGQSMIAVLIPVVGPVVVLAFAKDANAPLPKPDDSRFDPNHFGSGD